MSGSGNVRAQALEIRSQSEAQTLERQRQALQQLEESISAFRESVTGGVDEMLSAIFASVAPWPDALKAALAAAEPFELRLEEVFHGR